MKIKLIFLIILIFILSAGVIFIQSSKYNKFRDYKTTKFLILNSEFLLLIADTPEKWEKGLMYVRNKQDIGGADGMIFIFPEKNIKTFWNKNTYTDLDLYWLDNDKVAKKTHIPSITKTKTI
jgi:uncharacterized membrane protein (UPF0127 family)